MYFNHLKHYMFSFGIAISFNYYTELLHSLVLGWSENLIGSYFNNNNLAVNRINVPLNLLAIGSP